MYMIYNHPSPHIMSAMNHSIYHLLRKYEKPTDKFFWLPNLSSSAIQTVAAALTTKATDIKQDNTKYYLLEKQRQITRLQRTYFFTYCLCDKKRKKLFHLISFGGTTILLKAPSLSAQIPQGLHCSSEYFSGRKSGNINFRTTLYVERHTNLW